jgi:aspartate-semialdehyde dehydrogenase
LDAPVARELEPSWAAAGALVVSNASAHRMRPDVPLVVPEVNAGHLGLLRRRSGGGAIVANPNCSTIGLVMALKPLVDAFGLDACLVSTMQAASGAGYPGVPSLDLIDNVVPYIAGEEEKLETEPMKILGALKPGTEAVQEFGLALSASCHRVAVRDGHLMSVSVRLKEAVAREEILAAWEGFRGPASVRALPSAPARPLVYRPEPDRPQPHLDRGAGGGMGVSLGRLRPCPILGWKFELLTHNTLRGAAGGTLFLAELCAREGLVPGFARLDAGA